MENIISHTRLQNRMVFDYTHRVLLISAVGCVGLHVVQLGIGLPLVNALLTNIFRIKLQNGITTLSPIKLSFLMSVSTFIEAAF